MAKAMDGGGGGAGRSRQTKELGKAFMAIMGNDGLHNFTCRTRGDKNDNGDKGNKGKYAGIRHGLDFMTCSSSAFIVVGSAGGGDDNGQPKVMKVDSVAMHGIPCSIIKFFSHRFHLFGRGGRRMAKGHDPMNENLGGCQKVFIKTTYETWT